MEYIAHRRESDKTNQSVECHLLNVSTLCAEAAGKIGLSQAGELIGLMHDLGKYSELFQRYIGSGTGLIPSDSDDYLDPDQFKGKVDHSTAGAQRIWNRLSSDDSRRRVVAQMLFLCVASHHSGLIDCINPDGSDFFSKRLNKDHLNTHVDEIESNIDPSISTRADELLKMPELINSCICLIRKIHNDTGRNTILFHFQSGLLIRFLFSCLLDADRMDSADFEFPENKKVRQLGNYVSWEALRKKLETFLHGIPDNGEEINRIRRNISTQCLDASQRPKGIFTLTVPTGGGKTLASLRFALHHAEKHRMDRIFYIIPYTSIIDQNAATLRGILEGGDEALRGSIVLEHHSNIVVKNEKAREEKARQREKLLSENWDAPIIFTTSVQFLESLFGSGTKSPRRMHQLSNAIIIFDEIQTLPVQIVHMFNNAINFLTKICGSSVVLCTATQPLLSRVDPQKGNLVIDSTNEMIEDVEGLFADLKRVKIVNRVKTDEEWSDAEIASLARNAIDEVASCLVIVNTKAKAKSIYRECLNTPGMEDFKTYHLSTNMCAAHRYLILEEIRENLKKNEPILCVSTQLIEAGVDVDFGSVIRSVAGMDSIAQAAGRCNRNNKRPIGNVYVINPEGEKTELLPDIEIGKDLSKRLFREFSSDLTAVGDDWLHPDVMERYFEYYFFQRKNIMHYPLPEKSELDDNLLNMLSENKDAVAEYKRQHQQAPPEIDFRQSFMSANKKFKVIGAGTQGIIVPYGEGKTIIAALCSAFDIDLEWKLLKKAQRYTVNVYPNMIEKLRMLNAIYEVKPECGIFCLREEHYDESYGISEELVHGKNFTIL